MPAILADNDNAAAREMITQMLVQHRQGNAEACQLDAAAAVDAERQRKNSRKMPMERSVVLDRWVGKLFAEGNTLLARLKDGERQWFQEKKKTVGEYNTLCHDYIVVCNNLVHTAHSV
eukprot:TRINITY_DN4553_c0_g1_i5.p2 TRINITY_DN4553_c0_g1~~TRINITY_DN4553_c0_g1_i5.p2  ORF type:complete len:118 (+),score=37.36 TRINITY_DN4553_c0_g1_i5:673-1026(+)